MTSNKKNDMYTTVQVKGKLAFLKCYKYFDVLLSEFKEQLKILSLFTVHILILKPACCHFLPIEIRCFNISMQLH